MNINENFQNSMTSSSSFSKNGVWRECIYETIFFAHLNAAANIMNYVHKTRFLKLYHIHIFGLSRVSLREEKNSFSWYWNIEHSLQNYKSVSEAACKEYAASILKSRSKSSTSFSFTKVHSTLLLQRVSYFIATSIFVTDE